MGVAIGDPGETARPAAPLEDGCGIGVAWKGPCQADAGLGNEELHEVTKC